MPQRKQPTTLREVEEQLRDLIAKLPKGSGVTISEQINHRMSRAARRALISQRVHEKFGHLLTRGQLYG